MSQEIHGQKCGSYALVKFKVDIRISLKKISHPYPKKLHCFMPHSSVLLMDYPWTEYRWWFVLGVRTGL
jgi:hypothetical protein